jgi:hypothetical protein
VALPLLVAALLLAVTGVAYAVDQPDPDAPGFLSPAATGPDGGSRLAGRLRADGVEVRRVGSTREAVATLDGRVGTLFVPAPERVHRWYATRLTALLPGDSRLVLVDPQRRSLADAEVPLTLTGRRWATRAVGPTTAGQPCGLPGVRDLGTAGALRQRYAARPGTDRCYAGGVARVRWRNADVVAVGTGDPFRNGRIGEHDNAALAVALLAVRGPVVWLDLTGDDPPPPAGPGVPSGPGGSRPDGTDPGGADPGGTGVPGEGRAGPDDPPPPAPSGWAGADDRPNPLWAAFPPWFWALLVQLALAVLVAVLWRARRFGPPVTEPLPVTVRSAETVFGRARLYRRARARRPAAEVLRAAALGRLLPALHPRAGDDPARVAAAVAARTGRDPATVHDLLYGRPPATDTDLLDLARALDGLARTVADRPAAPRPRTPEGDTR